jgi:hypothetical protein
MMRGSIYWAHLDKKRPVVVVSNERRNQLARDLIVVPLTIPKDCLGSTPLGLPLAAPRMQELERAIMLALGIVQ